MDSVLKKNFSYLFLLQNANYIIPLILLPYLANVLGSENFGKVNFAQAVISYFSLVVEFGFNVSSTQEIAKVQNDRISVSKIFCNTMYSKVLFVLISFITLYIAIQYIPKLNSNSDLLYTAFIGVVATALFPMWLFLGIEKMGFITILNVMPRLSVLLITFLYVNAKNDYLLALQIQIGGIVLTSVLSLFLVFYKKIVLITRPNFKCILLQIKNSWPIFVSGLATNLYTTTNIVVLGFISNDNIVGIYSAADKVIKALTSLLSAITQVIFPRVNVYFIESKEKALDFIIKVLKIISGLTFMGGVFLLILSSTIVRLLFGFPDYFGSIQILRITSFLPMFATINGIIAINILVTFNLKNVLLKVVGIGGIFSLCFVFPLTYFFGSVGTAIVALSTEIFIFCLMIFELKKRNLYIFNFYR